MIRQNGGIFGRNPTFNDVEVQGDLSVDGNLVLGGIEVTGDAEVQGTLTLHSDVVFETPTVSTTFGLGGGFDATNVAIGGGLASCAPDHELGEGINNLSVGVGALFSLTTGSYNMAVGPNALSYSATGSYNTAIGSNALTGALGNPLTGSYNIGIGPQSCAGLIANTNVIGIGQRTLSFLTSGNNCVAIGLNAGMNATSSLVPLSNAENSLYIGTSTKASAVSGNTNEIVIGSSALGMGSNSAVLGHTTVTQTYLRGTVNLPTPAIAKPNFSSPSAASLLSTVAAGTGVSPTIQIICPSAAYTLTNGTSAQDVFSSTVNAITTTANTTYMVEGQYLLQTGTTSHATSISFASSGAISLPDFTFTTLATSLVFGTAARAQDTNLFLTISGGLINSASTSANTLIRFWGILRTTDAGTITPRLTFSVAPGSTNYTLAGSYLQFFPIGANTVDSVGSSIG